MTVAPAGTALPRLGEVVEQGLGLRWQVPGGPDGARRLAGLALRDNPKRAHLVVSTVLAKHLPVPGARAEEAGHALGDAVRTALGDGPPPVVLGYCETATALGQLVAERLPGAVYVHTTRRPDPAVPPLGGFEEEHSHATAHVLQPREPAWFAGDRPLVLVDDELTTGRTLANTLAALPPHRRVVAAALLDLRPPGLRDPALEVVATLAGELVVPEDVQERAAALRAELAPLPPAPAPDGRGRVVVHEGLWPSGVPATARTGLDEAERDAQAAAVAGLARALDLAGGDGSAGSDGQALVLGTEELLRPAVRLAALLGAVVHSTTRSPVLAADLPGYAVRRALVFPAPDEPSRASRLHGLPDEPYDDVVVLVDGPHRQPLVDALRPWARRAVHVVVLP